MTLNAPSDLIRDINRRKSLKTQRRDIFDNIAVIARAIDIQGVTIDIQGVTAEEIIKVFAQNDIKVTLISSYYLSVLKENMGLHLPTIKTQDVDFLVRVPYKGKKVDIESVLKPIGFSIGFNPEGFTYFTNGVFKVEFLIPERGKGIDKAVLIKPLKIKATPLRYLEMFFDQQVNIEKEGYTFLVPSPWVFAYHKILISKKRKSRDKKGKDVLQVDAILREIFKKPEMSQKALSYLATLSSKRGKNIKNYIAEHLPNISLLLH